MVKCLVVLTLFASSCTAGGQTLQTSSPMPAATLTVPTQERATMAAPVPTSTADATPSLVPGVQPPATAAAGNCPAEVPLRPNVLHAGMLIFGQVNHGTEAFEVWALTPQFAQPQLVFSLPNTQQPSSGPVVSPDAARIAWLEAGGGKTVLTILNLQDRRATSHDLPSMWINLLEWPETDSILLGAMALETADVGAELHFGRFSPTRGDIAEVVQSYSLPGYMHFEGDQWDPFITFLSRDPSDSLAIYTALGTRGTELVLYDLTLQRELWRDSVKGTPFLAEPEWTQSGSSAVLSYRSEAANRGYQLVLLDRTGQVSVISPPFHQDADDLLVRTLHWSSDERYIFYSLGGPEPIINGPAYMLDRHTRLVQPVCDEAARQFLGGKWIGTMPLFVYAVQLENGDGQYWLLDADNGTKHLVSSDTGGLLVDFVAWVPTDMPVVLATSD
jgi:hypothetical protein